MNTTVSTPRLSPQQVRQYHTEGYLLPAQQVFAPERFQKLTDYFDSLLATLPPDQRPESMDVPHFVHPELFEWLFADEVLDLVEPILGPDLALFSSHFICKPRGDGRRVPWHEDSFYWKGALDPMEVVTIWLAIDPSTPENGCMQVIPHALHGYSEYEPVDPATNVFATEIRMGQFDPATAVPMVLQPGQCSLHDARLIHGSNANRSNRRRCGYTMRFISTRTRFNAAAQSAWHQIYLARGQDRAGNVYADPTQAYPHLARYRETHGKRGH